MNLGELRTTTRSLLRDVAKPYLWPDTELDLFINEAQREACERAQLLLDISTPDVVEIPVTAGERTYPLHPSILKIKRAKLDLGDRPLVETSAGEMDAGGTGWFPSGLNQYPPNATWYPGGSNWESLQGTPERYIPNADNSMTLIRIPVADDTLRLQVVRLPLCPMKQDRDEPEINARHHLRMLDWALRLAYLKQDNETMDENKAAKYEALFLNSFGLKPDANVQRKRREGGSRSVRMGTW